MPMEGWKSRGVKKFARIRALSSRDRFSILLEKVHLLGLKIPLNRRAVDIRAINRKVGETGGDFSFKIHLLKKNRKNEKITY
jgi:hypothetical protein